VAAPGVNPLKTYRYLRLAMVMLIFLLATSIVIEWWDTGRACWQTSISAYYYTPVQAIFVSTLVSIGVCMIVLKGNSEAEDVLLNLGGMLAPIVALVPTPGPGSCRSVAMTLRTTPADIANNVPAVFVAGLVGLALSVGIAVKERSQHTRSHLVGFAVAAVVLTAGIVWFRADRDAFTDNAHYTAAIALFGCIIGVVVLNARGYGRRRPEGSRNRYVNRYLFIAVAMVLSLGGILLWRWVFGWEHAMLWIEGVLISLFATFWLTETDELWEEGLRLT
jgi:hypothetical protein